MTSDLAKSLYVETLMTLQKATGNKIPRSFVASVNAIHDDTEPKVQKWLQDWFKKYRLSVRRRLARALAKADSLDDQIQAAVEAAIGSQAADEFPDLFNELVAGVTKQVAELGVTPNWELVNKAATKYLRDNAENYFSDLADSEARGIKSAIADAMENSDGYTIKSIVSNILKQPTVYTASRNLDVTDWASMVARTETARAASYAQRETLLDVGMKTWQWAVQASGCVDCSENDNEIVPIGDAFPSGDSEPPAHPRCRCVVIPVMDELTSMQDDDNSDDSEESTD